MISSYHRPFLVIFKWTYLWLRFQEKLTVKIWSCTWSVVSPNLPFFIIYMFLMAYTDTLNTFVFHFHPQYLAVQTNWRWYFWLGQWTYIFHLTVKDTNISMLNMSLENNMSDMISSKQHIPWIVRNILIFQPYFVGVITWAAGDGHFDQVQNTYICISFWN